MNDVNFYLGRQRWEWVKMSSRSFLVMSVKALEFQTFVK